jgi:hypothetical protein
MNNYRLILFVLLIATGTSCNTSKNIPASSTQPPVSSTSDRPASADPSTAKEKAPDVQGKEIRYDR